jgi:hypothetical protein
MLNTTEIIQIAAFTDNNPKLYKTITSATIGEAPIHTLYKMSQNLMTTYKVYEERFDCKRYFNISDAVFHLNRDNILVIIQEIGVYLLFDDIDKYNTLANSIVSTINDYDNHDYKDSTFSPYQILLKDQHQKIIFFAKNVNDEDVTNIKTICEKKFNTKILVLKADNHIEFTFQTNIIAQSFNDTVSKFNELSENITKYHAELSDKIQLPPVSKTAIGNEYIKYYVGNINQQQMIYDLKELLKYIPSSGNNINITFNNNNGNGNFTTGDHNGDNNTTYKTSFDEKKLVATEKWINSNLPEENAGVSAYYDRCKLELDNMITSNIKFNSILRDLGYEQHRKNNICYWKKCKKQKS